MEFKIFWLINGYLRKDGFLGKILLLIILIEYLVVILLTILIQIGNMKIKAVFFGLILTISACSPTFGLKQQHFESNLFKTQGLYYTPKTFETYFFYDNGTVLGPWETGIKVNNTAELTTFWKEHINVYGSNYKNDQYRWDLIHFNNRKFIITYWMGEYQIGTIPGLILNDSTLLVTRKHTADYTHVVYTTNDTLHFQYLAIKPDSTDKEIK